MCNAAAVISPRASHPETSPTFEDRLIRAYNDAAMVLMISLGHRAGLLNALAGAPPLTSNAIAERAGLNERYVREWLGAMVAARVVETDPGNGTYQLPAEHAALLTNSGNANLAVFAQYIPLLGTVEDDVVRCFREGGGVPYERYGRFHEVMAEDSGQTVLPALIDHILPLVPGLAKRLESGIDVLDVGCGRGRALLILAQRYPQSRFTGYDLSPEAVAWAQERAHSLRLSNVRFDARDLSDFDRTAPVGGFDFVTTFDAVHDQARPLNVLRGIHRALRSGGAYLMQDIHGTSHHDQDRDHILGTFLYALSTMHCMTVSLAQGGEGLGAMWGREKATTMLRAAGFKDIVVHRLEHDAQNDYYVIHKDPQP